MTTATLAGRLLAVTSPAPRAAWERCYASDPGAVPSQAPSWTDAMVATGRWADASRHYTFSDGREAVLPLVRPARALSPTWHASMPDAWGYGDLLMDDLDAGVVAAVVDDLASIRTLWVRIRPRPEHAAAWRAGVDLAGSSVLTIARHAHVLDLDRSAEDLFTQCFTGPCRTAIRKAERSGLEVEEDRTGRLVPEFHALLLRSVERWAEASHEPARLARARALRRDPIGKFDAWAAAMGDRCRILVARRDGTAVAAMVVLQDRNAHMTRSAMDTELVGKDRANELLMWHAIRGAVDAGCRELHLGESGTSTSLAAYKGKFGAVGHDYHEIRIEHVPATRIDAAARGAVKRIVGFREP